MKGKTETSLAVAVSKYNLLGANSGKYFEEIFTQDGGGGFLHYCCFVINTTKKVLQKTEMMGNGSTGTRWSCWACGHSGCAWCAKIIICKKYLN